MPLVPERSMRSEPGRPRPPGPWSGSRPASARSSAWTTRTGPQELVAYATQFTLGGRVHTLVSLQVIRAELEARELEAWEQLSRVLTHEITNSVAPIASLAGTARARVVTPTSRPTSSSPRHHRAPQPGAGLVRRRLPDVGRRARASARVTPARELLDGIATLFRTTAAERGVALEVDVDPPRLDLVVDPDLVEQALVNLVLNALEAAPGKTVRLVATAGAGGRGVLSVTDDGPGIEAEALERVFVPFFSTKAAAAGSGWRSPGGSRGCTEAPSRSALAPASRRF